MLQRLRQRRLLDVGGVQVRNGPPDAVMMTRGQFVAVAGRQRLEQRVVFGIDRQDAGAGCRPRAA